MECRVVDKIKDITHIISIFEGKAQKGDGRYKGCTRMIFLEVKVVWMFGVVQYSNIDMSEWKI